MYIVLMHSTLCLLLIVMLNGGLSLQNYTVSIVDSFVYAVYAVIS